MQPVRNPRDYTVQSEAGRAALLRDLHHLAAPFAVSIAPLRDGPKQTMRALWKIWMRHVAEETGNPIPVVEDHFLNTYAPRRSFTVLGATDYRPARFGGNEMSTREASLVMSQTQAECAEYGIMLRSKHA